MKAPTFYQFMAEVARKTASRYEELVASAKTDAEGRLLPDPRRFAWAKATRWAWAVIAWLDAMRSAGEPEIAWGHVDADGDGRVTVSDLERVSQGLLDRAADWARDPVYIEPQQDMPDWVYGADRVHDALGELRNVQSDMLEEVLRGEITPEALREALDNPFPRDKKADAGQSMGTARDLGGSLASLHVGPSFAALGVGVNGRLLLMGYCWRVLFGGWTRAGLLYVDEAAQRTIATSDREAKGWPLYNDERRFGDAWRQDANCPAQSPVAGDALARVVEQTRRWSRVGLTARWRALGGAWMAPMAWLEHTIRVWWDAMMAYVEGGHCKEGDPLWGKRNDIFVPFGGGVMPPAARREVERIREVPAGLSPVAPPPPLPPPVKLPESAPVPYLLTEPGYAPAGGMVPTPPPSPLNPVNAPGVLNGKVVEK